MKKWYILDHDSSLYWLVSAVYFVNIISVSKKVVFSITEKRTRLVIDGLRSQEDSIPPNYSASNELPIYLGGVPSLKLKVKSWVF